MKVAIVTNAVYNNPPEYERYTNELKKKYVDAQGVDFHKYSYNPHPGWHPVFSKFEPILKTLEKGYDWIIWMDCDAAPVNHSIDVKEWLKDKPQKVIMLKDALGWNAGVFAVPNCQRSIDWLKWLDTEKNMRNFDKGFRDQDEMAYTFATSHSDFILDDGYEFGFNNYDDIYPHAKKPNLFVEGKSWCLHIPGYRDDYRANRFGNILRKMEGKPEVVLHNVRKESLSGKTVSDYIKEGATSVLIDYPHGLGDLIMFYPHFKRFCEQHKDVRIDLRPNQKFAPLITTDYLSSYDTTIYFPARFNERDKTIKQFTKPEVNVKFDLGGEYDPSLDYTEPLVAPLEGRNRSILVGLNFCCSVYPLEGNCNERLANFLWNEVMNNGLIPFEVYVDKTGKVQNRVFPFIRTSMRNVGSGINRLMSLLASLKGMASVSTGTFHYGMAAYPETTLYLKNGFDATSYTRKTVLTLDVNKPDKGVITEWLSRLKDKNL